MTKKSKTKKVKHYEPHYLLIILAVVLLLEGFLVVNTREADWGSGLSILNLSPSINQTISDTAALLEPVADTINSVSVFYQKSATALAGFLDLSTNNPIDEVITLTSYITAFYENAADELTVLFDLTDTASPFGKVAGASTLSF
jgi:hypothetical protein